MVPPFGASQQPCAASVPRVRQRRARETKADETSRIRVSPASYMNAMAERNAGGQSQRSEFSRV
jgi:hypothetical protein